MVQEIVPGSRVRYAPGGGPDARCYRVDCGKLARTLPQFRPAWTLRRGIEQLYAAFAEHGLTRGEFLGSRYVRIARIRELQRQGRLDARLRAHPGAAPRAMAAAVSGERP
jgi:hypothetical protein